MRGKTILISIAACLIWGPLGSAVMAHGTKPMVITQAEKLAPKHSVLT